MSGREIARIPVRTICDVRDHAVQAGQIAARAQQQLGYEERQLKDDDSVLTAVDLRVERYLHEQIRLAYPQANVLGEEDVWTLDRARPYTFVIDPIDGTDVYSQGMHGWCVSVGLLDETLCPVAGVVVAPRLDLTLFADLGQPATVNGSPLRPDIRSDQATSADPLPLDATTNVMAHSRVHRRVDLQHYPGKVRSIGSAALHICFTLVYPGIYAAIESEGEHVWDIAGAHAILRSCGYELTYLSGAEPDYERLIEGEGAAEPILAGRPEQVRALRDLLTREQPSDVSQEPQVPHLGGLRGSRMSEREG
jgi:fructose-1,6-bisphosphatase/inositol monophosphatase family enzyme